MKILHVSSWFQPQLGYSEFHLPQAQQRMGETVAVLASDRYYPFPDYDATVKPLLGERIVGASSGEEFGLQTFRLPVAFEYRHHLWLRGFDRVVAEFQPEIVHVHEPFTLTTFQSARTKEKSRYVLVIASSMEKEVFCPQTFSRRGYYSLFSSLLAPMIRRNCDALTAVGVGAQEIVADVLRVPVERVERIPLGADSERFKFDAEARRQIRQRLGIADDLVLAIYAGKLIPEKDVHVLAEAMSAARPEAKFGLLLLGNGAPDYLEGLISLTRNAHQLWVSPAVSNEELPRYFSAAELGVWPSQSSNAAIEAALVGVPLIVSETQATRHYIEAGNGLSFPRGDVRALARNLEKLADDPALRKQMSDLGRGHIEETMSWKAVAGKYLNLYRSLAGGRQERPATR